ncbi:Uncharacterized protein YPO0396 [Geosporobacter subterraneus DSM 17957]|uniref:Uncharacterized protein YPO0396 n=1 Tax=Geosporobacter subterraneus DSM 17957 TaxID=1121919 RepID=A0A1M6KJK8_9FIRM|nr:SbcC/MukB-like Walker B domain-containing protein [Geosporobacter subterraneus]SHJ59099.1 Uncharacterized protein YPO0396 [Geosporobacter subterraneus DSM 17957]
MKILKKMLLINWHYFWNEMIEFENINFLTGKNAAGKSTIIDALQLLLLGDTSGHFFNKAANEKSGRTLKGYLRGEQGDDGDVGYRYLREGRFTSYIACELYDSVKSTSFTLGVVFDCYGDGTEEHRFFILNEEIPQNRFIIEKVPMSFKDLRNYFHKHYKKGSFEFPDSNRRYQELLKGKLGGIKNKYFSLFKKAVPFTPITDIETFITEYVCDVKSPIDISLMQENIRHYKRLELDTDMMEQRLSHLQSIEQKYDAFMEEKQRLEIQRYIIERAKQEIAVENLLKLEEELAKDKAELQRLSCLQEEYVKMQDDMKGRKEKLIEDKISSDIYRKQDELTKQKRNLENQLENLKQEGKKTTDNIRKYGLLWRSNISRLKEEIHYENIVPAEIKESEHLLGEWNGLIGDAENISKAAEFFLQADMAQISDMSFEGFKRVKQQVEGFKERASGINHSYGQIRRSIEDKIQETKTQLEGLEKGIKPYDKRLLALRDHIQDALEKKYNRSIPVHILSDLLEINDMRWRNAVEAYLHTQKFYLFVEPEYFIDALKVYDQLKFQQGFYDWGLVDTGKIGTKRIKREPGSLAEEIITEHPYAQQFIDLVLGNVIKCDQVEALRNYTKSITDTCMLYQNFVARQLNPERWKTPYIGRKSIQDQIIGKQQELIQLAGILNICRDVVPLLKSLGDMEVLNNNEVEGILQVAEKMQQIPGLQELYHKIVNELGALDLTWITGLEHQIKQLEEQISQLGEKEKELIHLSGTLGEKIRNIEQDKIPKEQGELQMQGEKVSQMFDANWCIEIGEPRFAKELGARNSAQAVYQSFFSQVARTESQVGKKKSELTSVRAEYNRDYKMSYDIHQETNSLYDRELKELMNVRLPAYKKQIQDAKEKTYEQFRDDFLAKLKSNIDTVKGQIEELNGALKQSSFGNDRYRFVIQPKAEYKRYYDMITDEMLLEGFNISSQIFRDKHKDAIEELFKQIISDEAMANADARAQLEKNIKRFTDYRTYLHFDLVVTDDGDRNQRLSRTLLKKSGGETQTPFYISVLASFAQLYRIRQQNDSSNTVRLIVFDEAFSKMDSERIQESIKLLRRFGLQAVISAPPEKIGDIAALVDRNLCVIRDGNYSCVKAFDGKKLMEAVTDEL